MIEDMVTVEELADAMDDRKKTYKFFSDALLHEYTETQIGQLRQMTPGEGASSEVVTAFATIRRYLAHAGVDPRTDLAVDYARIFLSAGVYEGRTAEPYESAFTGEEYLLMQESRDDVVRIYRQNGMEVDESLHMPEDHLGLELEFLSVMAEKTAVALRKEQVDFAEVGRMAQVQTDFCNGHILNWIDLLMEKVGEFAKLPLYPALMRIIKAFIEADADSMAQLADSVDVAAQ